MNSSLRAFRVWDGEEMHYPPHDFRREGDGTLLRRDPMIQGSRWVEADDDHEDMQYTGRDDAEGTPIYEGDLLRPDPTHVPVLVRWESDRWAVNSSLPTQSGTTRLSDRLQLVPLVVVGNRYENSELLEEVDA